MSRFRFSGINYGVAGLPTPRNLSLKEPFELTVIAIFSVGVDGKLVGCWLEWGAFELLKRLDARKGSNL